MYSFELDLCFVAEDVLWAQGWPLDIIGEEFDRFSHVQIKQLAGTGFGFPCVVACNPAYYFNPWADWWAGDVPSLP